MNENMKLIAGTALNSFSRRVCVCLRFKVLSYEMLEIMLCTFVKIHSAVERAHDIGKSDFVYLVHVYIRSFLFIISNEKSLRYTCNFFCLFFPKTKM